MSGGFGRNGEGAKLGEDDDRGRGVSCELEGTAGVHADGCVQDTS